MRIFWSVIAVGCALAIYLSSVGTDVPQTGMSSAMQAGPRGQEVLSVTPTTPAQTQHSDSRLRLLGVISQGEKLSALIELSSGRADLFTTNSIVEGGWLVRRLGEDFAILSDGTTERRLDIHAQAPRRSASEAIPARNSVIEFQPGAVPTTAATLPDEVAKEKNRQFLEIAKRSGFGR
jgi:hypothetical protein